MSPTHGCVHVGDIYTRGQGKNCFVLHYTTVVITEAVAVFAHEFSELSAVIRTYGQFARLLFGSLANSGVLTVARMPHGRLSTSVQGTW